MALLLLDLDSTLVDRAAAFRQWAEAFATRYGVDPLSDVAWLIEVDDDGFASREDVAERISRRFRLDDGTEQLVADLRRGMVEFL